MPTTAEVLSGLVNRLDQAGAEDYDDLNVAAQTVPYRHRKKASLAKADLPTSPGVYRFISRTTALYVGRRRICGRGLGVTSCR